MSSVISQLIGLLPRFGVRHAVCSPGSRNAAILKELDENSEITSTIIADERSAGFVALGIGLISKSPVVLICTSGSALLNYAPAVAEAYYQGIPLIVISADRPLEWINQDDSQTIVQPGALNKIVKEIIDLDGERNDEDYLWYANRCINEGLNYAITKKEGPVHFNVRLNGLVRETKEKHVDCRKIEIVRPLPRIDNAVIREFTKYAKDKKILFVAGFMLPDYKLQKAVLNLASLPNVCVLAETLSNLHLPLSDYMIDTVLFPLNSEKESMLRPDIVISIGGALISRKLKEFLRRNPPKQHWSFNYSSNLIDCFKSLTVKLECLESTFISAFSKLLKREQKTSESNDASNYQDLWLTERIKRKKNLNSVQWSDLKALSIILKKLPLETNLFLSNGTAVRYSQILPYRQPHATYGNRGVSGIEGCCSTAIGSSLVYNKLTCLISGDMSFKYDIGILGSGLARNNVRIIVLDNNGGDIFRFINATKDLGIREKYLCVPGINPIESIATAFNWEYFYASDEETLKSELEEFFSESIYPAILHVDTRNVDNSSILSDFLNNLKQSK